MVKSFDAKNHVRRITSRYPEDGLEAKLALPLHDIATDKGISGDLDSSLLQKQSTA